MVVRFEDQSSVIAVSLPAASYVKEVTPTHVWPPCRYARSERGGAGAAGAAALARRGGKKAAASAPSREASRPRREILSVMVKPPETGKPVVDWSKRPGTLCVVEPPAQHLEVLLRLRIVGIENEDVAENTLCA